MTDSFSYALTLNDKGVYVLRSTVESFNLQQVTDKNIVSFYQNFSNTAAFDTGLLPLDGTGVLAIRAAGNHMQVTVQHKPGTYYINWGSHEGDSSAKTYNLAQPYRIIIGDFVDGQLLGARMFYSPYPVTHPDMQLYHVNLPNINCKGYQGNAVGWICLYLKEDWSQLPLNEKISRFIERCSGVETYNDANMSQTDGPRFYKSYHENNDNFDYLWDPVQWQKKSSDQGYEWTLNPDTWIPVKVKSIDNQSAHDNAGIPLTLSLALLGNYQAYYTDKNIPKFYNLISRQDLNLTNDHVVRFVKKSFSAASVDYNYNSLANPLSSTIKAREDKSLSSPELPFEEEEQEEFICYSCEHSFPDELTYDHQGNPVCGPCLEEYYIYLESVGEYYPNDDANIIYDENTSYYYHIQYDTVVSCDNCQTTYCKFGQNQPVVELYTFVDSSSTEHSYCKECVQSYADKNNLETLKCSCGSQTYISNHLNYTLSSMNKKSFLMPKIDFKDGQPVVELIPKNMVYCSSCIDPSVMFKQTCPCGILVDTNQINKCSLTPVKEADGKYQVVSACSQCIGNIVVDPQTMIGIGEFVPQHQKQFETAVSTGITAKSPYVVLSNFVEFLTEENEIF